MKWTNQSHVASVRQASFDVITGGSGVRGIAKTADQPRNAHKLFFMDEMLSLIVKYANECIHKTRESFSNEMLNYSRYCYFTNTTNEEILAFIGLMYTRGLLSLNKHATEHLFSGDIGHPVFGATMSKHLL